ncbi:MAG: Fis family transcriptional regulator [Alphaproteobacteria bacterium]|nr:Fis family transcriptional regulator [Alphaproteobacteria bacterium]
MAVSIEEILDRYVRAYLTYFEGRKKPAKMYDKIVGLAEKAAVKIALEKTNGNQLRAAKLLGINRNTLHSKIKKFKINGEEK